MALADGLAAAPSGFAAALGLGVGEVETGKGFTLLFATVALADLADLAAVLLLLALAGMLTLLLDFVLAMTKTHQKGFNPS
jgi:hypothetical protein